MRVFFRYIMRTRLRDLLARLWFQYVRWYVRRGVPLDSRMLHVLGQSPDGLPLNGVLKSHEAVDASTQFLQRLRALRHFDRCKNWDLARALSLIMGNRDADAPVLDVGCGWWGGMLLPTLRRHGYRNLNGCDASLPSSARIAGITCLKRDFFATNLPDNSIRFITCLSVIEHGVVLTDFLKEAHRILVPGGLLIISTDYWHEGLTPTTQRPFGMAWRIFDRHGIVDLLQLAAETGFLLPEDLELEGTDRLVTWLGLSYTFVFMAMRKSVNAW